MNQNKIEDLRDHLFDTIKALKDKDNPMDIYRAKAIAETAKVIVETAKAETDYLRVTGAKRGSGFIPSEEPRQLPGPAAGAPPPVLKAPDGKGYTGKLQADNR